MNVALSLLVVGLYLGVGLLLEWRARPRLPAEPASDPSRRLGLDAVLARRRLANRYYLLGGVATIVLLLLLNLP